MERVLERLDEIERNFNEKLDGNAEEFRTDIGVIKRQLSEHRSGGNEGGSVANGHASRISSGYKDHRGMIANPKGNRTAKESSFISVGKVLYSWIDGQNEKNSSNGNPLIDQIDKSSSAYARKAMKVVELVLGGSKVFCPFLGVKTFQEIKTAYATQKSEFQKAYSDVNKKLVKALPELELADKGWAAYELIKGKLVNMKEEAKKASQVTPQVCEDQAYDPEEDGINDVEDSEEYDVEAFDESYDLIKRKGRSCYVRIEDVPVRNSMMEASPSNAEDEEITSAGTKKRARAKHGSYGKSKKKLR